MPQSFGSRSTVRFPLQSGRSKTRAVAAGMGLVADRQVLGSGSANAAVRERKRPRTASEFLCGIRARGAVKALPQSFATSSEVAQIFRNPAAMNLAIRAFTAAKSAELHSPPDSLSIRPVRARVSNRRPIRRGAAGSAPSSLPPARGAAPARCCRAARSVRAASARRSPRNEFCRHNRRACRRGWQVEKGLRDQALKRVESPLRNRHGLGPVAVSGRELDLSPLAMPGSIPASCATLRKPAPTTASTPAQSSSSSAAARWLAGKRI